MGGREEGEEEDLERARNNGAMKRRTNTLEQTDSSRYQVCYIGAKEADGLRGNNINLTVLCESRRAFSSAFRFDMALYGTEVQTAGARCVQEVVESMKPLAAFPPGVGDSKGRRESSPNLV